MLSFGTSLASFNHPLLFRSPPFPKPYLSFNRNTHRLSISISASSSIPPSTTTATPAGAVVRRRKRFRKAYPGESKGIVEEMRFVAMRLRKASADRDETEAEELEPPKGNTWRPSMEGFLKYLVDSKLVFETLERIVDESSDVAYTYFRKTGLERSGSLSEDLEWFRQQGFMIPPPSPPGITCAAYLAELSEKSAPSFLSHLYNIYFAHISGGQGIGKQVSEQLLQGRELEFYKWEGDAPELLKDVREKLNKLGEHWSRDEKSRCLREAAKSFQFSGQIVRLIILK